MLTSITLLSKRLQKNVTLQGREEVDNYGHTFLNVDNNSLSKAFEDASNSLNATISMPQIMSNDPAHPAFQCMIKDDNGCCLPIIGEASADTASGLWKQYPITLAQTRCVFRAIIRYLELDYPNPVYSFSEGVKGQTIMTHQEEKDAVENQSPSDEEILQAIKELDQISDADTTSHEEIVLDPVTKTENPVNETGTIHTEASEHEEELLIYSSAPKENKVLQIDETEPVPEETPAEPDYGSELISFGKYKTNPKTIREVCETDPKWFDFIVHTAKTMISPAAAKQVEFAKKYAESRKEA